MFEGYLLQNNDQLTPVDKMSVGNRGTVATVPVSQLDISAASFDYSTTINLQPKIKQHTQINSRVTNTTSPRQTKQPPHDEEKAKVQFLGEMRQFIRQHFHRKECSRFVPLPNQKVSKIRQLKCHCGGIITRHLAFREKSSASVMEMFVIPKELQWFINRKRLDEPLSDKMPKLLWQPTSIQKTVTNTYGKINFVNIEHVRGTKPAKYIRITDDDSVDDLLTLMIDYWHIMEPQCPDLVISVVGGAKNFKLDGRMRDTFSTGLIKAAKTTSAWLITSGFNMGVMKAVGQAVQQGQSFCWDNDRMAHVLRCIGIAPWGYVEKRMQLESEDGEGLFNADFLASKAILHGEPVPLNPDHTHFIFVDDGYRNRYGGVAAMRAKLEQKISQPKSEGGLQIPVVLVVVEGGTDAILDAKKSLEHRIPVVVCAGTGRAADILAYAYNHTKTSATGVREMSPKSLNKLKDKIFEAYGKSWKEDEIDKKTMTIKDAVQTCCQKPELMNVFHMNKHEELDLAILSLLLKSHSGGDEMHRKTQLRLALMWDRVDIAQEQIFREDVLWKQGSLDDVMIEALLTDRLRFVELILQQGCVSMKEFLTMEKLNNLYKQTPPFHHIYGILFKLTGRNDLTIQTVHLLLGKLLDRFDMTSENLMTGVGDNADTIEIKDIRLEHPYKHLMIWAVLTHRQNLAKYCWEMGEEPITSAVAMTRLYIALSRHMSRHESEIRDTMMEYKMEFEKLATNVLDECQQNDPNKTMMIVEKESRVWNNMTCLQIAAASRDQQFLSSQGCQDSILSSWKQGILSGYKKIMIAAICPLVILFFMEITIVSRGALSWKQKLSTFYSSPVAKFMIGTLLYMMFIILHTYMVLVDFRPMRITPLEIICVLWVFTFAIDKIHTFLTFPAPTLVSKVRDWYGLINWMEGINYLMCFVGFLIHWLDKDFYRVTKIIYCLNAAIFLVTFMKAYTTSSQSGPKLVMIKRMMGELKMFVMIIMVFLLAYGVSSQALMYSKRSPSWTILKDVIFFPYWSLYGEIYLEEIDTADCTPGAPDCRTSHWLVPFLLAFYLMGGNILLLNLLIAIFSNVFDVIDRNSLEIWKYEMYFLVMEHDCKTILVPPFSIVSHIFLLIRWIYWKVCCKPQNKKQLIGKRHLDYLELFEKEMMTNYLRRSRAMQTSSLHFHINNLEKRVDALGKLIEDELLDDQQQTTYFTTTISEPLDKEASLSRDPSFIGLPPIWPPVDAVLSVRDSVMSSDIPQEYLRLNKNRVHPVQNRSAKSAFTVDTMVPSGDSFPPPPLPAPVAVHTVTENIDKCASDATAAVELDRFEADSMRLVRNQDKVEETGKKKKHKKDKKKKKKKDRSKERTMGDKEKGEEESGKQNNLNVPLSVAESAEKKKEKNNTDISNRREEKDTFNRTEKSPLGDISPNLEHDITGIQTVAEAMSVSDMDHYQQIRQTDGMPSLVSGSMINSQSPGPLLLNTTEDVLVSGDEGIMEEVVQSPHRSVRYSKDTIYSDTASEDNDSEPRRIFSKMRKWKKKKKVARHAYARSHSDSDA